MKEQGIIEHNQFALCFGRNGGRMSFGGYNHTLNIGNLEEMPVGMKIQKYYYIDVYNIRVYIYILYIYVGIRNS